MCVCTVVAPNMCHLECEHEKKDEVRKVLKAVRASLEADSPTSDDVEMEPPEHRKDGSGATEGSGQTDEPTKPRFSEYQWYDSIRTMSEVGDLDEYGRFCIEGRDVTKLGPQNVVDLNEVVRDAIVRGGGDTWSVQEFLANYSDNNIRKPFYKRIEAPQDGFLKIIPTTGAHFYNCFYFGGVWSMRQTIASKLAIGSTAMRTR